MNLFYATTSLSATSITHEITNFDSDSPSPIVNLSRALPSIPSWEGFGVGCHDVEEFHLVSHCSLLALLKLRHPYSRGPFLLSWLAGLSVTDQE